MFLRDALFADCSSFIMGRTSYSIEAHNFGVSNYIVGIYNPSQQIGEVPAQQIESLLKWIYAVGLGG